MKNIIKEFQSFALLNLAVGVVIGSAFGKMVSALVEYVIMPVIGLITGGGDLSHLSFTINDTVFQYGMFIQAFVDFMIIAFCVFYAIRIMNKLNDKLNKDEVKDKPENIELLTEIRDLLKEKK
ncbi:MAG: large conductance mechanosensitive channel protein MscL [Anaerovoracaceae bacterium]